MNLKESVKDFLAIENEPPKFRDFSKTELEEIAGYFESKKEGLMEAMNKQLWEIETEEEDYMKGAKAEFRKRKDNIIEKFEAELKKLNALLNSIYYRLGPEVRR